MQRSALCRSRRELSNEYLLAKFGFDTAENEPCKVCPLSAYRSPRCAFYAGRKTDTSPVKAMFAAECTLADDDRNDDTGTGKLALYRKAYEQILCGAREGLSESVGIVFCLSVLLGLVSAAWMRGFEPTTYRKLGKWLR